MPIYEYKCSNCGRVFEKMRPFADADKDIDCPHCSQGSTKRILSSFFSHNESGCTSNSSRSCSSCSGGSCSSCH